MLTDRRPAEVLPTWELRFRIVTSLIMPTGLVALLVFALTRPSDRLAIIAISGFTLYAFALCLPRTVRSVRELRRRRKRQQ